MKKILSGHFMFLLAAISLAGLVAFSHFADSDKGKSIFFFGENSAYELYLFISLTLIVLSLDFFAIGFALVFNAWQTPALRSSMNVICFIMAFSIIGAGYSLYVLHLDNAVDLRTMQILFDYNKVTDTDLSQSLVKQYMESRMNRFRGGIGGGGTGWETAKIFYFLNIIGSVWLMAMCFISKTKRAISRQTKTV